MTDYFQSDMPDPDWGRVLVNQAQKRAPVGDPTLWGNTVTTLIDEDPVFGNTPRVIEGAQVLLAQAGDKYARSWTLTGSLGVRGVGWRFQDGAPADGDVLPAEGMNVYLSVLQGLGQITLEQRICLACNGFPTNIGICWNQSTVSASAGPYVPMYNPTPVTDDSYLILPFACVGAFVGNAISVRGMYLRGGNAVGGPIPSVRLSCILTPYAPGQGL